jgi:hypothetical protein
MVQQFGHFTPDNPGSAKDATFVSFEDDPDNFLKSADAIREKVVEITKKKTGKPPTPPLFFSLFFIIFHYFYLLSFTFLFVIDHSWTYSGLLS